jgi:hypothetical protein
MSNDYLAHYGKLGMKWGHHKAKVAAEKAAIYGARSNQAARKNEINDLTQARIRATTTKGKRHLDDKIADKSFELKNNPDARTAARLTTGEKWLKGARVAALVGASVVGLGVAASVVNTEMDRMERLDGGPWPKTLHEFQLNEDRKAGKPVSLDELFTATVEGNKMREKEKS